MTLLAGVIGDPIGHSRSPRLHGHWLHRYGVDGQYVPLHVRAEDLAATLRLLPRLGFAGLNVTLPHKEAVFALADRTTDRARAVGAANTLTFRDGCVEADNTDGAGFVASLDRNAPGWCRSAPAVVLGAGGAARGIIAALLVAGVPKVTLVNRTRGRAAALAAHFGPRVSTQPWPDVTTALDGAGLLVNTTSLGMEGRPRLDLDLSALPLTATVTDIVYTPVMTRLLAAAGARGNPTVDGVGMLLHQAAPGFAAWFGITPEVDEDLRRAVLG